jgi:nitrogen fixation-related uncharacterized protein
VEQLDAFPGAAVMQEGAWVALRKNASMLCASMSDPASRTAEPESRIERDLFRVASLSSALAFGCMAAVVQSLKSSDTGIGFHISTGTFVAFAAGAIVALVYWRLAVRNGRAARRASWILGLASLGVFIYSFRFIAPEKQAQTAIGLALALTAISVVVFFLWGIKRYFDADEKRAEETATEHRLQ